MEFTVTGNGKIGTKAAYTGDVRSHGNQRLTDAVHNLIEAMPDGERDIHVKISGDLIDREVRDERLERRIVVEVTSSARPEKEQRREFTPEEEQANLDRKRAQYQEGGPLYEDAGRHTTNDKGERTDINALPVGDGRAFADRADERTRGPRIR